MKALLIITLGCVFMLGILKTDSARADDTEVYITSTTPANITAQPNVLFVFDTSGSMDDTITTVAEYDSSNGYGSSDTDYYYYYEQDYDFIRSVHEDYTNCQSLKDTIATQPDNPVFNGRVARWKTGRNKKWKNIGATSTIDATHPVECEVDGGVHGSDASSVDVWARNGNSGPYSSNSNTEINWSRRSQLIVVSANYHDYLQSGAGSITRRKTDIMKDAAKDLIDDFDGLNFGLMRFSNDSKGGYVVSHFADITPAANKIAMKNIIDALPASGGTPLAETLWEASRYYRGESIDYGTASVAAATTGNVYNSPMTHSCQKNHIVYLTDGEPYSDSGRDSSISMLTGTSCSHSDGTSQSTQTCFDEMGGWLKDTDHSSLTSNQDITLHTIGFDIEMDLLAVAAQKGGGNVYNATDATELKSAFNQIILNILSSDSSFTAPAVTVNAYNNLQHRDELYYAVFKPLSNPRWPGNVKRYRITSDASILDVNDNNAIDATTGFFRDNAKSFWSSSPDGHAVTEGGFAGEMSTSRNIYTYTGNSAPDNISLNDSAHRLVTSNSLLTNTMMGLDASATSDERDELIGWIRGEDVEDTNSSSSVHNFIADLLHNRPLVVTYGGTESNPDSTIFAANNMGMLNAINADDGSEAFAFIPQDLLPNSLAYFDDITTTSQKTYGLDGELSVWLEESSDADVTIESADGDHVYLYIGMRRGGSNYYALDVTNRNNPALMWQIEGGSGDYIDLAQTWAKPRLATVKWACDNSGNNCTDKKVLIFSGGYDDIHDTATVVSTADNGAAIYMVDATSGARLWSAGRPVTPTALHDLELSNMQNSITADLTLADTNSDGYLDMMFTVDITGHVWRFDFNADTTDAADFATGGIIAKLGDYDSDASNDAANFRRFFYAPDVAFWAPRGKKAFFSISVASGYRAHPRNTGVSNRIYTLFDSNVFAPPKDGSGAIDYASLDSSDTDPLDEGDLFDATTSLANKYGNAPYGWYKNLTAIAEKGLSSPTVFASALIFSTYSPVGGPNTVCGGDFGGGRVYVLDPLTGGGKLKDSLGNIVNYVTLVHAGIPPAPTIIYTDDSITYTDEHGVEHTEEKSKPIVCVGTECFDDLVPGNPLTITFWKENR